MGRRSCTDASKKRKVFCLLPGIELAFPTPWYDAVIQIEMSQSGY